MMRRAAFDAAVARAADDSDGMLGRALGKEELVPIVRIQVR